MIIYGGKKEATNAVMGENLAATMNAIVNKNKTDEGLPSEDETVKETKNKKMTKKK